jgi:hypothetical protein
MALVLYSVVRRHMKQTGRYIEVGGDETPPAVSTLEEGESLFGWYRNPAPSSDAVIAFSDRAIYSIEGATVVRIPLTTIIDYETPASKADVTGIRVLTRNGPQFLRATGSFGPHGTHKDAFSLMMVLRVVVGDQERAREQN